MSSLDHSWIHEQVVLSQYFQIFWLPNGQIFCARYFLLSPLCLSISWHFMFLGHVLSRSNAVEIKQVTMLCGCCKYTVIFINNITKPLSKFKCLACTCSFWYTQRLIRQSLHKQHESWHHFTFPFIRFISKVAFPFPVAVTECPSPTVISCGVSTNSSLSLHMWQVALKIFIPIAIFVYS